jgi:hypothetical protein
VCNNVLLDLLWETDSPWVLSLHHPPARHSYQHTFRSKAPSQLHKHISQQLLIRTYCGHEEKNSMLNMYTEMPWLPSILSTPSQRKAKVERQEIQTVILGFSSSTSSSLLPSSASCRCQPFETSLIPISTSSVMMSTPIGLNGLTWRPVFSIC